MTNTLQNLLLYSARSFDGCPPVCDSSFVGKRKKSNFESGSDITKDSIPDYDSWGPDIYWWTCDDWVLWHKKMLEGYGKEYADNKWVQYYDDASWGSVEISCATNNDAFKMYVISQGLDKKSSILSRVYRAETAIDNVVAPIQDIGSGIGRSIKVLSWIVPVLVGVFAIGGTYYAYNHYIKKAA